MLTTLRARPVSPPVDVFENSEEVLVIADMAEAKNGTVLV